MSRFLIGLLIGIILVPAGFYLYLRSGDAPVATWAQPMPFERFLVKTAMRATIDNEETPIHLGKISNGSLVVGAHIYQQNCAFCHGLPNQTPTVAAKGMFPPPPQFFRPNAKKIDDPASEIYWKVKNGIRLTGMPGFRASLSDAQILELTGFLEEATALPPAAMAVLKTRPAKTQEPSSPSVRHAGLKHRRA
ncbi:MAG: cytochrome c [Acidobacteria bacterium]|nr:cytochrome c [Acidobacteriota bacterium]